MNEAILNSLKEAKHSTASFETMNPEQRMRVEGTPVGLKNVGNSIELLFHIKHAILTPCYKPISLIVSL